MNENIANQKISPSLDIQALEQEYKELAALSENYCLEVKNQIDRLLEEHGITLGFPVQYRVKEWGSMAGKLEQLSPRVSSVIDIQDLSGLRLILLFKRDVDKVCSLLSEHFNVIRRYDTQERLAEDQFGYSSIHFIVKLPEAWLAVPTLSRFKDLIAEIQVRTLAQHIWAATSHVLQYKQTLGTPPSVRRAIHRASALLEVIDLEFERVLEEREAYRATIDVSNPQEQKLNVDLLEKTLDSLFPPANKVQNEPYAQLLNELFYFGIDTQQDLKRIVEKHLPSILADDAREVQEYREKLRNNWMIMGLDVERIQAGVYFQHTGLARKALTYEFGAPFDLESVKKYASGKSAE